MQLKKWILAGVFWTAAGVVGVSGAQPLQGAAPQNVLQLTAEGRVEVQQDWLQMTLATTLDGRDAATVQTQLKAALDAALQSAKPQVVAGQMDARTGGFHLSPRYTNEGKIQAWQGRAELILEGRDFARITQSASRINSLTVAHVGFALSREQRERSSAEAQKLAIDRFGRKATELAKSFGFSGYTLREVSVNDSHESSPGPQIMPASAKMMSAEVAAVPVEAGKSSVTVMVSGSVQLR